MAYNQNYTQKRNDEVRFDLMEHIGVLGKRDNGWTKEVNIVAWNGGRAKVDIREWDPDHARMTKGITLFEEEAETLAKALARRYGLRYTGDPRQAASSPSGTSAFAAAPSSADAQAARTEWPQTKAATAGSDAQNADEEGQPAENAFGETMAAMDEQEEDIPFEGEVAEQS